MTEYLNAHPLAQFAGFLLILVVSYFIAAKVGNNREGGLGGGE